MWDSASLCAQKNSKNLNDFPSLEVLKQNCSQLLTVIVFVSQFGCLTKILTLPRVEKLSWNRKERISTRSIPLDCEREK